MTEPRGFRFRPEPEPKAPAIPQPSAPSRNREAAMAPADPPPGQDDDTDCGYYDTPSGNIWCPDTAPAAGTAQPALPAARDGGGRRGDDRHRAYEFTPPKRHFRRRCRQMAGSGFGFGLCCLGSSAGLMAMLVVLGAMSVGWMAVVAVLAAGQKLLPPRAALDVPMALAIVAFGMLIIVDPSAVPG